MYIVIEPSNELNMISAKNSLFLMTIAITISTVMSYSMINTIHHARYDRDEVPTVRLYEHRHFGGGVLTMANIHGCANFDHTYFNDRISSIDTRGHCFYVYEDARCQGELSTCKKLSLLTSFYLWMNRKSYPTGTGYNRSFRLESSQLQWCCIIDSHLLDFSANELLHTNFRRH